MKAKTRTKGRRPLSFAAGVGHALRRAAKDARKTARMYGTPLRVGKRQGCGEEAVRLCHRQPQAMQSYIRFVGIFVGTNIQAIN